MGEKRQETRKYENIFYIKCDLVWTISVKKVETLITSKTHWTLDNMILFGKILTCEHFPLLLLLKKTWVDLDIL